VTTAEKKLIQDTHDTVIQLKTIIIGNGVAGLSERVRCNSDFIARIKDLPKIMKDQQKKIDKHDHLYSKMIGGGAVLIVIAQLVMKVLKF